jgi:hypothetical protein
LVELFEEVNNGSIDERLLLDDIRHRVDSGYGSFQRRVCGIALSVEDRGNEFAIELVLPHAPVMALDSGHRQ